MSKTFGLQLVFDVDETIDPHEWYKESIIPITTTSGNEVTTKQNQPLPVGGVQPHSTMPQHESNSYESLFDDDEFDQLSNMNH